MGTVLAKEKFAGYSHDSPRALNRARREWRIGYDLPRLWRLGLDHRIVQAEVWSCFGIPFARMRPEVEATSYDVGTS